MEDYVNVLLDSLKESTGTMPKKKLTAVAASAAPVVTSGLALAGSAVATEDSSYVPPFQQAVEIEQKEQTGAGTLVAISDSTVLFVPESDVTVDLDALTITQHGHTEELPRYATDLNGTPVSLIYTETATGIHIDAVMRYQPRNVWKCVSGIGGGAITGAGTLRLAGSAVGTVTLPLVGTVAGGTAGAITGMVGGGLTGAATFCW